MESVALDTLVPATKTNDVEDSLTEPHDTAVPSQVPGSTIDLRNHWYGTGSELSI